MEEKKQDQKGKREKAKFNPPKDKNEILEHIKNITFKQRLKYGADIGRKCENADELIKQLRDVWHFYNSMYIFFIHATFENRHFF